MEDQKQIAGAGGRADGNGGEMEAAGGWCECRRVQQIEDGVITDFQNKVVTADRAIATFLLLIATPDW